MMWIGFYPSPSTFHTNTNIKTFQILLFDNNLHKLYNLI